MKTAVIYARYSSDNQTEQSIEGQLHICQDYAKNHNITIIDNYIDRAMTGTNDNRPAFRQMIKDSHKKSWNYVLVYKMDRFSRNKYEMTIHKHTLMENGIKLISAMENIPDTPEGTILLSLLEGMNQYYSEELSQKVLRGMNESRSKGNFIGGFVPYGYDIVNRKFVIDEEKAKVVNFIFSQYLLGVYVKDIVKSLNDKGIYKDNKPFSTNAIYLILRNERYTGVYEHNNIVYENTYPPIISKDLFQKVKDKILKNKYGKRSIAVDYVLRNKMVCGYCGKPISAECGKSENGEVKRYYKCLGRKHKNGCKKSIVRKEYLENLIYEVIKSQLSNPEKFKMLINKLLKIQDDLSKENFVISNLQAEKHQVELAIKNIMTAIEQGVITNTTTKRLKELETKQEELESNLLIEQNKTTAKVSKKEIETHFQKALELNLKMLVNVLIDKIVLLDDKMKIYFHTPINESPDENRDFLLLSYSTKFEKFNNRSKKMNRFKFVIEFKIM